MKILLWSGLLLIALANTVVAQSFNSELELNYTSKESDFSDTNSYEILYRYYFAPLKAETGPLALAELVGRSSTIELNYFHIDEDASSLNAEAEADLLGVIGQYLEGDYGLVAGIVDGGSELNFNSSGLRIDGDIVMYTLGAVYYPEKRTRMTIGYFWGDNELKFSDSSPRVVIDHERLVVSLEKLIFLDRNRYLGVDVAIGQDSEEDSVDTEDTTFIDLAIAYYFSQYSGFYVGYEMGNGEGSDQYDDYSVHYEYFLNDLAYVDMGYRHKVDNVSTDSNEFSLTFTQRF